MKYAICVWLTLSAMSARAQLDGIIDLHVHSAPDNVARSIDAFEAARIAQRQGMRALLFKNHFSHTASLAYLVHVVVPGIEVYGAIALNRTVGGLNAIAVQHMADTTGGLGRVVWMPTFDSEHNHRIITPNPRHVSVSRDGQLLPEVFEVLDVIAARNLALATGHSSPSESLLLIRAARERGIDRIIVTHPTSRYVQMPLAVQREAAQLGALLEYPLALAIAGDDIAFEQFVTQLREVGPEHVALSTDLGQAGNPIPTDGYVMSLPRLLASGITQEEVDTMTKRNPARFLALH
jgi:hypothetical protein